MANVRVVLDTKAIQRRTNMMKVYKGIVKGNTVILEEKPDLPDECPALVEIKPIDQARDEEISRRQIELLRKAPRVGKLLYKKREELYDR
jgi:hypothetical protein